jgi:hypothetical protein
MKRIAKILLLAAVATATSAVLIGALVLFMPGSGEQAAQASGGTGGYPTMLGFDMDPYNAGGNGPSIVVGAAAESGSECENDVDDDSDTVVNDGCGLGQIDSCIRVDSGTFNIDVFVDDIPTGKDLGGFDWFLEYDNTLLQINNRVPPAGSPPAEASAWLLAATPGSSAGEYGFAGPWPHTSGSMPECAADVGGAAAGEPAGSLGPLERYELEVVGAGPTITALTLTPTPAPSYLSSNIPTVHGYLPDELFDGTHIPAYGLVAIGQDCSEPADVKKVLFEALDDQLQPLPQPLELNVSETYWLKLHEQLHNNGPATPLPVELTIEATPPEGGQVSYHVSQDDLDLPGDLLVTKNGQPWVGDPWDGGLNPPVSTEFVVDYPDFLDVHKQVVLDVGTPVDLYEDWDIHCFEPSTHVWAFHNEVSPLDPYVSDPDPANNEKGLEVIVDCTAESDVDVTNVSVTDAPAPIGPLPYPTIVIGTGGDIEVTGTLHNIGPYGPTQVTSTLIAMGPGGPGTVAAYLGMDGATYGDCTITGGGPIQPSLDVSTPTYHAETFHVDCGRGGIEIDDDADALIDEDPINGIDDDGDCVVDATNCPVQGGPCQMGWPGCDEDSPFYLVLLAFTDGVSVKQPHITDPDDTNDLNGVGIDPPGDMFALAVIRAFNPDAEYLIESETSPTDSYPTGTDCIASPDFPCKSLSRAWFPDSSLLPLPFPGSQPLATISSIVSDYPGEMYWNSGAPWAGCAAYGSSPWDVPCPGLTTGAKVGKIDFLVTTNILGGDCVLPVVGAFDLWDACLPPQGYDPAEYDPDDYVPDLACTLDLDGAPAALFPTPGTAFDSWSSHLDGVVQTMLAGMGSNSMLWARYVGVALLVDNPPIHNIPLGFGWEDIIVPVNILMFDTGASGMKGAGLGPFLTIGVTGDPTAPPALGDLQTCAPFSSHTLIMGEDELEEMIKYCVVPTDVGVPHIYTAKFTRLDTGESDLVFSAFTCTAPDTDVYCDLEMDEAPYAPVKLEHQETVDVVVTNGVGPDDVSVEVTLTGPVACDPQWLPAYGHDPDPPTPINGDQESVISFLMSDVLGRGMNADEMAIASLEYEVYCEAGTHNLQISANVMPVTLPDPDTGNNECQNQPVLTAEDDDVDDDTIVNWVDLCPWDPEDPDGIQDEDGCPETDADSDGILDEVDLCPEDAEDFDGIQDEDGCPETDADNDGILDEIDLCPEDPEDPDGIQDDDGCPETDADNDGFPDDQEVSLGSDPLNDASTPEHIDLPSTCTDGIDNDLDGLPDLFDCDTDYDGIANYFDACPFTAEDMDGYQDDDGCPDADNDMDGVCDPWAAPSQPACTGSDDCPNVAEDIDSFGDTDGCPDPDNDDDGFPDSTDFCPGTDWTAGPDGIADSGDEPLDELGVPIQTKEDYDGVIDWDGCHDSPGDDWDSDGISDEDEVFKHGSNPTDMDTDNDGLCDGHKLPLCASEDANNNGIVDPGETDPTDPDTDGDGLSDGLERGLTVPETPDTDTSSPNWQADADPASTTDPLSEDSDDDGIDDGAEDPNQNGAVDSGETDPGDDDTDDDGYGDAADNCPAAGNPGQADADTDGAGDACDVCTNDPNDDADNDGICVGSGYLPPKAGDDDNCPAVTNPDQADGDEDAAGDACDNCALVPNPGQENHDDDLGGDACDPDDDNGGTPDNQELRNGTDPWNPADDLPLDTDDTDGDNALNWEEDWVGTDYQDPCSDDCHTTQQHDAWAYDINIDCWCSSVDILMFPANVNMAAQLGVEPTYQCRYDLSADNWVSSVDILMFPFNVNMADDCEAPPGVDDPEQP